LIIKEIFLVTLDLVNVYRLAKDPARVYVGGELR